MADINAIAEQIQGLTLLEASQLVKMLEEKLGVSAAAAAPMMMAAPTNTVRPTTKSFVRFIDPFRGARPPPRTHRARVR